MLRSFLVPVVCAVTAAGCDFGRVSDITEPTPLYSPPPPPPPRIPPPIDSIAFGEVIRLRFTTEGFECGGESRCLSYYVTPPSDGTMDVVITPTTPNDLYFPLLELYIVPGADDWNVGAGPQISATARVKAGQRYEIRMAIRTAPSSEFELRTSLR